MFLTGAIIIAAGVALAFTCHYFFEVRRTNKAGIVEVDGFWDYIVHLLTRVILTVVLTGIIVYGFSFIIRGIFAL
ncbi:hypothetical protein [Pseudaestuariivita rosea]|uniref:hypothetical protein n=1 Tax=Pseudaestuariivita rosea TaxID=2763263 RepID=UPI001ABA8C3B|nr:hypothetical protein [Pseudaestuariivita rosea]